MMNGAQVKRLLVQLHQMECPFCSAMPQPVIEGLDGTQLSSPFEIVPTWAAGPEFPDDDHLLRGVVIKMTCKYCKFPMRIFTEAIQ